MMVPNTPFVRDLVILGGGHANVEVLRRYGMKPEPGVRVTAVAREPHTPYSGMLPGYLAGKYSWDEIHIDVLKLSTFANARFIPDEVTCVDLDEQTLRFRSRPDIRFDVLALNTGGAPGKQFQNHDLVIPVKPIGRFIPAWERVAKEHGSGSGSRLTVVGGGPGSVEVALAVRERYGDAFDIHLVSANDYLLREHNGFLRRTVERELRRNKIAVSCDFNVVDATGNGVVAQDGRNLTSDCVLWVAGVEAPDWIRDSGFAVDAGGFLRVNKHLQSVSHPNVFAAGDIVCLDGQERPKSGVYAVREGPLLAQNTRAALTQRRLRKFRAQRLAMAILRLPRDRAVASKGPFSLKSKPIAIWKDWIDRQFMRRFSDVPIMKPENGRVLASRFGAEQPSLIRCGGCGSKLGADLLDQVLRRLNVGPNSEFIEGIGDDAAVVDWNSSRLVTTCDGFRSMLSDPYQFGRISANHALNDLYAMGSEPRIALAVVTVPLMSEKMMQEELFQSMSGAVSVFREANVKLVGGHSGEGTELSLGFAITGTAPTEPIRNSSMDPNHALVLTKPLGTGLLLAGVMRGTTLARELVDAIAVMDQSNAAAADIFLSSSPSAMTDVTGFGLLGHLSILARHSDVGIDLFVDRIATLPGVRGAVQCDVRSSLHENNVQALMDYENREQFGDEELVPLVDPQTCGGLVAAIPHSRVDRCIADLRAAGFAQACQIGVSVAEQRLRLVRNVV